MLQASRSGGCCDSGRRHVRCAGIGLTPNGYSELNCFEVCRTYTLDTALLRDTAGVAVLKMERIFKCV